MEPIVAFIPAHPKDFDVLPWTIASINRYVRPKPSRTIVVARKGSDALARRIGHLNAEVFDEAEVPGLPRLSEMPRIVVGAVDRTGWYYQQFMKWQFRKMTHHPTYAVFDADTILIRPLRMMEGNRAVLRRATHYDLPYFDTFEKLLGFRPERQRSYIVDHMLFDVAVLDELIGTIEARSGRPWIEAVLATIDRTEVSSFSEFETYGYFLSATHPDRFVSDTRRVRSLLRPDFEAHWWHLLHCRVRGLASISYHAYPSPGKPMPLAVQPHIGASVMSALRWIPTGAKRRADRLIQKRSSDVACETTPAERGR